MPTEFFTVEPSADIFLSVGSSTENSVTIRPWVYDSANPPVFLSLPDPAVSFAQSNTFVIADIVAAGNNGKVTASQAGTAFVRVTYEDSATIPHAFHQMVIRVS